MARQSQLKPVVVNAEPSAELSDFGLAEVVELLAGNWLAVVASIAISMAIAAAYLTITTAQFTATALLLIDARNSALPTPQLRATDANAESAYVETQVSVLNSERIARTVILEQKLQALEEFKPKGVAAPAVPPESAVAENPETKGEQNFDLVRPAAVKEFGKRLEIKRSPSTYIISIGFTFSDPEKAADIANAVAYAYISDYLKSREQAVNSTSQWLRLRTMELKKETQAAEIALDDFRNNNSENGGSTRSILRDLESTAQSYRMISDNFQKRFLETSQQLYFLTPEARVVSKAWPPPERSHPKTTMALAIAFALGLAAGVLIAIARSLLGKRAEA
ncbi:MAG: GumC protein [Hyphomicrobiales bacterium]|jgi:uncharacterized protein involved in exopolysaccharide biosynthesis